MFTRRGRAKWDLHQPPWPSWTQSCRVHGLEGLRVVDASVMPAPIRANVNATTMMLAERIAVQVN